MRNIEEIGRYALILSLHFGVNYLLVNTPTHGMCLGKLVEPVNLDLGLHSSILSG